MQAKDMKVKSTVVKRMRAERMWSQEQLAEAAGLGLRTVQRLEAAGTGSQETVRALAAVFEVPAESLVWRAGGYQTYCHRQWGLVVLVILPMVLAIIMALRDAGAVIPGAVLIALGLVFTGVGIVFSSMTIAVNEQEIVWYFGPGLIRKRLPLSDIDACRAVKNPWWMGIGIHAYGTGWIYNVSGMLGVELALSSGASVRLGTDQPKFLVQAINDAKDAAASQ
ncbi:helix-turn-helix transcriptional regulator [Gilvimarinus sp. SDUM040013]|uniref:Helix-turn-helix transcriptional regulator n=1 Tax=Gilvimarinus gilvus TaxID=3058038 RepID=A0ABU4RUQ7_9GAMM|nr:helix-turn-helix transcriptional regulator [Gilvimarinus sp. SDUM040013]MDO3388517.1 helix-turn-helix transcriptional regulator [Gilvimarinus sp. SDUM040013]MDX6848611.1 helix-turn-helix transcriptional regulator [Gilvimarinus sp. SDUM040013]